MKKIKSIGQRIVSVLLVGALLVMPVNMNGGFAAFAAKTSEKTTQEVQKDKEKKLEEIRKQYEEDEQISIWEILICVAAACGVCGLFWMANKATFPEETEVIENFLGKVFGFAWKGIKTGTSGVIKLTEAFYDPNDFKDNLAAVGAASIVYFSIKTCKSVYNKVKAWFKGEKKQSGVQNFNVNLKISN